jgi:hypothetical protein
VRLLEIFNFESSLTCLLLLFFLWENLQKCLFDPIFSQISLFQIWLNFWHGVFLEPLKYYFNQKTRKNHQKYFCPPFCMKCSHCVMVRKITESWLELLTVKISTYWIINWLWGVIDYWDMQRSWKRPTSSFFCWSCWSIPSRYSRIFLFIVFFWDWPSRFSSLDRFDISLLALNHKKWSVMQLWILLTFLDES